MKKLLVLALAAVSTLSSISSLYAADIKFEGDFRVRGIYTNNTADANKDANDQLAFADGRFRLKTTATAGITSGVVVLDFTNAFRDPSQTGAGGVDCSVTGCRTGNYRFGSANFGGSYGIVGVRQAYLALDMNVVKLAFGRKPLMLGHGLILDDTVDAIVAKLMAGPLEVVLADAKLLDINAALAPTGGGTGSDTDLFITKFGYKHEEHNLGLFVTYLKDRGPSFISFSPTPDKSDLWTVGLTADGKLGPVSLMTEVDFLTGKADVIGGTSTDLKGTNVLIWGGLDAGMVDVSLALLYTSGDDSTKANERNVNGISGNFVLGNILINDNVRSDRDGQCASAGGLRLGSGGSFCVAGLGVTGVKLGIGIPGPIMPKEGHTELAVIWAQTTKEAIPGADKNLGIEIDLNHRHKLDQNVAINVNLGYLISGDAWKTLGGLGTTDNQLKGILSLNYMF